MSAAERRRRSIRGSSSGRNAAVEEEPRGRKTLIDHWSAPGRPGRISCRDAVAGLYACLAMVGRHSRACLRTDRYRCGLLRFHRSSLASLAPPLPAVSPSLLSLYIISTNGSCPRNRVLQTGHPQIFLLSQGNQQVERPLPLGILHLDMGSHPTRPHPSSAESVWNSYPKYLYGTLRTRNSNDLLEFIAHRVGASMSGRIGHADQMIFCGSKQEI